VQESKDGKTGTGVSDAPEWMNPETYKGMSKINAIKALREWLGPSMTLVGAKALMDSWESNGWWSAPNMTRCPNCDGRGQVGPGDMSTSLVTELTAALKAMRTIMDRGPKPQKLDAALSWAECDDKARAMCDAAILRAEAFGAPRE
jgi:hypothetical protein